MKNRLVEFTNFSTDFVLIISNYTTGRKMSPIKTYQKPQNKK